MTAITARQLDVLRVIARHIDAHGYAPSMRELASSLSVASLNGVNDHLRALERQGVITTARETARGIRITAAGRAALAGTTPRYLPICPTVRTRCSESYCRHHEYRAPTGCVLDLVADGESMTHAAIAYVLGTCPERSRQLEVVALRKLRAALAKAGLDLRQMHAEGWTIPEGVD